MDARTPVANPRSPLCFASCFGCPSMASMPAPGISATPKEGSCFGGDAPPPLSFSQPKGAGSSMLCVADRVVKEYERLLVAMPTLAQHMERLQVDTDAMAKGRWWKIAGC